jgi:hypothetical protein
MDPEYLVLCSDCATAIQPKNRSGTRHLSLPQNVQVGP